MKGKVYKLVSIAIFLICLAPAYGDAQSDTLVLSPGLTRLSLTPYLLVYTDHSRTRNIKDMIDLDKKKRFTRLQGKSGFGYSDAVFWFKLTITNPEARPFPFLIEYPYPAADHFELFTPGPDGFLSSRGGDGYPFDPRKINFRTMVVPVDVLPGTQTFYFNIQSRGAILASLTGWHPETFERHRHLDTAVNWLYYGLMLSTLIYCLFIFFSMKEQVFLWLGLFVLGVSFFTLAHTGLGIQYFWPNAPAWANLSHPLSGFVALVGALSFSRLFLNTSYQSPFFDRLLKGLSFVGGAMIGLAFILPYPILTQMMVVLIGFSLVSMIACGCLVQYKGLRQARFYLIAWSPFALSAILMGIKSYGFIENSLITDSTIQITASFVTFLFSFGLMDKINALRLEREGALKRLHQSERKYRMLADNVKDVIWRLDLSTLKITYITPSIEAVMGYTPLEAKTLFSFARMLPPESAEKAKKALGWGRNNEKEVSRQNPKGFTIELEAYNKQGDIFWTETKAGFLRDKAGVFVEMIGVTRDITARKQAEKEKSALEFQLNQSGKLEAMGTLAGGIAHDMNNIISAILGYAELSLYDAQKETPLHHRLNRVVKASYRARDLVRQILTFSRQERVDARTIKISLIVKEILALIRASLPASIDIVQDIQDRNLFVCADPSQVHQIVMNLCSNAGYAMMEKGGTLTVTIDELQLDTGSVSKFANQDPGPYVRLIVKDTGPGMDNAILERIFDPFYTTKPVGEGTGMGLSMVHGIVTHLGGNIHVKTALGHGSEFHIILPRANQLDQEDLAKSSKNLMPVGRERILYLDDESDIMDMARDMLTNLGYRVTGKTDSHEALELFRADPLKFDLLMTDQAMPGMTGVEFMAKVGKLRPGMPVILCTGFSEKIPGTGSPAMDCFDLLPKPYDMNTLAHAVRKALDRKTPE